MTRAGYRPGEPVAVGIRSPRLGSLFVARPPAGMPIGEESIVYTASLSKQLTAACLALLVRRGLVTTDAVVRTWLPELPAWADAVRVRHLIHHSAGLPDDAVIDAACRAAGLADRTTEGVLGALAAAECPGADPGSRFAYSNAGYVLLAAIAQRVSGQPLPAFAQRHLFQPLGMSHTRYWTGPEANPPDAIPVDPPHPAPLSLGDGGVWSSPADLLRWSEALNEDRLHISGLLQSPGSLDDGTPLDYAWGIGVRSHAGVPIYRHGGGWQRIRALLTRAPTVGLSLLTVSLDDPTERRVKLCSELLNLLVGPEFARR